MNKPSAAETRAVWSDDWFEYACEEISDEEHVEDIADRYFGRNKGELPVWMTCEWLVDEYEKRL